MTRLNTDYFDIFERLLSPPDPGWFTERELRNFRECAADEMDTHQPVFAEWLDARIGDGDADVMAMLHVAITVAQHPAHADAGLDLSRKVNALERRWIDYRTARLAGTRPG